MHSHHTRLPYLPALDGLRAVAVAAVLLFHADVGWMEGGHLGVTVFFTLSGFLITALLLAEQDQTGTVDLKAFWARRARRLVPAMFVCFGLVATVVALAERRPRGVVGDAVASATWVANWRFVLDHRTYADLFSMPSPFQHFWSLGIEEQFYVAFPILVIGLLSVGRLSPIRRLPLALVLVALAGASTATAAALHDPDGAVARAYYGTDARIAEPLVGALLALVLVRSSQLRAPRTWVRTPLQAAALFAAAGLGFAFHTLGDRDTALYHGGFLAVALATCLVIAASVQPGSVVGAALRLPPLVALGRVSYGVYLVHWPIFLLLTERSTGLSTAPLLAARLTITLSLAVASFHLVERPVRHGSLPRRIALPAWANAAVAGIAVVTLASGTIVPAPSISTEAASSSAGPQGLAPPTTGSAAAPTTIAAPRAKATGPAAAAIGRTPATSPRRTEGEELPRGNGPQPPPSQFTQDPGKAPVPPPPPVPPGAVKVAVLGDSVADNLATGLRAWAHEGDELAVYNLAVPACPVGRGGTRRFGNGDPYPVAPACGWWATATSERRKALESFDPDVVVVEAGVNELFDRKVAPWRDYRQPGDPTYDNWLRDEYQQAVDLWRAKGARIVLVNTPCADWDRYQWFEDDDGDVRVRSVNLNVYMSLVGVDVADLFDRVCPLGRYRREVEGVENGRPDGLHFSEEASTALARNWLGPMVLDVGRAARMSRAPSDRED